MAKTRLDTTSILSRRNRLVAETPPWAAILRGSLMRYGIECRSAGCKCHRGKKFRHGPYWYLVVHRPKGRQKLYFVPSNLLPRVRAGKKAYDRLWRNLLEISELNLLLLKREAR